MARISDETLSGTYVDGQIVYNTDMNKIIDVLKAGVNANYDEIQDLVDGTTPAGSTEALSGASLQTYLETPTLDDSDLKVSTNKVIKAYVDGEVVDINTELDTKVDENVAIIGATKTKVTYDSKGLVTSGADATTSDIADSANKRYVTDAQLAVLGLTSGVNTGDETQATIKTKLGAATISVDGYATATQITKLNGIETGAEVNNMSDTNVTDLTDGGATTLHKHSYNNLDNKPTIPVVTLNNSVNNTPGIYAPIAGGTAGEILKANGATSAPTWSAIKTVNSVALLGSGNIVTPDTTYSEISEAEISTGTASDGRTISGRRAEFIISTAKTEALALVKWEGTQAEYDALTTEEKAEFLMYFIV